MRQIQEDKEQQKEGSGGECVRPSLFKVMFLSMAPMFTSKPKELEDLQANSFQ